MFFYFGFLNFVCKKEDLYNRNLFNFFLFSKFCHKKLIFKTSFFYKKNCCFMNFVFKDKMILSILTFQYVSILVF